MSNLCGVVQTADKLNITITFEEHILSTSRTSSFYKRLQQKINAFPDVESCTISWDEEEPILSVTLGGKTAKEAISIGIIGKKVAADTLFKSVQQTIDQLRKNN